MITSKKMATKVSTEIPFGSSYSGLIIQAMLRHMGPEALKPSIG